MPGARRCPAEDGLRLWPWHLGRAGDPTAATHLGVPPHTAGERATGRLVEASLRPYGREPDQDTRSSRGCAQAKSRKADGGGRLPGLVETGTAPWTRKLPSRRSLRRPTCPRWRDDASVISRRQHAWSTRRPEGLRSRERPTPSVRCLLMLWGTARGTHTRETAGRPRGGPARGQVAVRISLSAHAPIHPGAVWLIGPDGVR